MKAIQHARRIVIKVGTSTLTYETGRLNLRRIEGLVRVLSDLKNSGREILLVTSGAIGVGVAHIGLKERPQDVSGKQAAAAVGQSALMDTYDKHFREYGHVTGQVLLTRDVVECQTRKRNVINTLSRLLEYGVLPIINENDTVAIEELELEFGQNDTLAAIVATLVQADLLILLTDIDGVYTANPRLHPDAELIPLITQIDDTLLAAAQGPGSKLGTGGMITKLHAAQLAAEANIPTVVMNGNRPSRLYALLEGEPVGTLFDLKQ